MPADMSPSRKNRQEARRQRWLCFMGMRVPTHGRVQGLKGFLASQVALGQVMVDGPAPIKGAPARPVRGLPSGWLKVVEAFARAVCGQMLHASSTVANEKHAARVRGSWKGSVSWLQVFTR